jgi:hypothetical protein
MTDNLKSVFDNAKIASKSALDSWQHMIGRSADPDVRRYEKLTDEAKEHLLNQFGPEAVVQYRQEMEARKQREKRGQNA